MPKLAVITVNLGHYDDLFGNADFQDGQLIRPYVARRQHGDIVNDRGELV